MKIVLEKDQNLFFTSDTHYGHSNICRGTTRWTDSEDITRDFETLDQMNDRIVEGINTSVRENDILFHLGDWSFGGFEKIAEFRNKINCKNIHIVLGNHDHHIQRNKEDIQSLFSSVNEYVYLVVKYDQGTKFHGQDTFVLMHYPITSWNNMNDGVIHLHGHVHFSKDIRVGRGKTMDVGVDGNGMDPLSIKQVRELMYQQPIRSGFDFDHHIKRIE
jgi:calcineurin-like phosphoesterase family protein